MKQGTILPVVILTLLFAINANAQVEYVSGMIVTDEATLIQAADAWLSSRDAKEGQTTTLLSNMFNGASNETHTYVLNFPDYAALQRHMDKTETSPAFAKYVAIENLVSKGVSESLYLHATDNGKEWKAGDYLFVVGINVNGPGPDYVAAMKELINSSLGKKAPGMMRLVAGRAGNDSSHALIISAPSFASLNEYLDSIPGNSDFEAFLSKVGDISTVTGTSMYRVVKVWK